MRVCDWIADYLVKQGIMDIFMVSGGGLMFLTDGLACNERLNKICCHHEQAVAMAAVGYAKYKGIGCGFVTTGCGGTNAITGVLNAWQDNTPCLFVSGQCKRKETLSYIGLPIRQVGVQEADIVSLVSPITKYAVMIEKPEEIAYHMEKALYLAKTGRPGPVWIDVPMDVQSAEIDQDSLIHYDSAEDKVGKKKVSIWEITGLIEDLKKAKRPVIVAGHGIRLANATDEFAEIVHRYKIPVVCSRLGTDVLPTDDSLNIGRIGNKGTRAANFAVQNADYVLSIGSRLSVSSTGQQYEFFAREAKIVAVDIDPYEHRKDTIRVDQTIIADAGYVIKDLLNNEFQGDLWGEWVKKCREWKEKYPVCLKEYYDDSEGINMYVFVEELSKVQKKDSVWVTDTGSALYVPAQGIHTQTSEQRYITSGAQAEMGFSIPAAVGVSIARDKGEVIAITGDGSFQMNIQELQTIVHNHLPVKLFVWNNDGYLSIRATQNKFFDGRFIGTDKNSGVSFPEIEKIAYAYGIKYVRMDKISDMQVQFNEILTYDGPVLCEVMSIRDQAVMPSVSSITREDGTLFSKPIEDMFPFLARDEFEKEMIVAPIKE